MLPHGMGRLQRTPSAPDKTQKTNAVCEWGGVLIFLIITFFSQYMHVHHLICSFCQVILELAARLSRFGLNWNNFVCHCDLVGSARTWDGTGCEFDSWQCQIYIISHVHRAYDYLGPFGVLWVHMAWHKNCVEKKISVAWLHLRKSLSGFCQAWIARNSLPRESYGRPVASLKWARGLRFKQSIMYTRPR